MKGNVHNEVVLSTFTIRHTKTFTCSGKKRFDIRLGRYYKLRIYLYREVRFSDKIFTEMPGGKGIVKVSPKSRLLNLFQNEVASLPNF